MYENEQSEDYWKAIAEDMGEALNVDTREGSVYMDAAAGHILRITKFYNDLTQLQTMYSVNTTYGDILTEAAARDGINRHPATPSYWNGVFVGTTPPNGTVFLCGEYYLTWQAVGDTTLLVAQISGAETNDLVPGAQLIPMENIEGLTSATLGSLVTAGVDEESDDALRTRWREAKAGPAENGNKSHYKKWCEEVQGIGRARILPLWGGENTVKAVLFAADGFTVTDTLVEEVQEYVDPIVDGYEVEVEGTTYTFGDGMGEGVANMGAHFLAVSAEACNLTVSATITLKGGCTMEQAENAATEAITAYLKDLALNTSEDSQEVVRISMIGSILTGLEEILDYENLKLNGGTQNITVDSDSVAVLSGVVFSA